MPEAHFPGGRGNGGGEGSGVQNMALPLLGGAKFSETSFSHFQTHFDANWP